MSAGLNPESNAGDLIDYLFDHGVSMHILAPDSSDPFFRIRVDCTDAYGTPMACVKCIDVIRYKSAVPEVRNMVVTQTIRELIKELTYFFKEGDKHDQT